MKYNPKPGLSLSEVLMSVLIVGIVLWFHYTVPLPSERQPIYQSFVTGEE